jgi:hypothetical protein
MGPLWGVAVAGDGIVVVGTTPPGTSASGVARWDGRNWLALEGGTLGFFARSIAAVGRDDIAGAGGDVVRWRNGRAKVIRKAPYSSDGGEDLWTHYEAVTADGRGRIWIGGYVGASDPERYWTLAELWDGTGWHEVSTPHGTDTDDGMYAIRDLAVTPSGDVWAAGANNDGVSGPALPLLAVCRA